MADFIPALPVSGKWSIYENDADHQWNPGGKRLVLRIPLESVPAFCQHLMNLADDPAKHKEMEVWDFDTKENKTYTAIAAGFNAKPGKEDNDGWYGTISPQAHKAPATQPAGTVTIQANAEDIPF
tara:strand:+ start:658 stop:1032 length:375 start_codon:yes stop_codon:yes gene_type:complete